MRQGRVVVLLAAASPPTTGSPPSTSAATRSRRSPSDHFMNCARRLVVVQNWFNELRRTRSGDAR